MSLAVRETSVAQDKVVAVEDEHVDGQSGDSRSADRDVGAAQRRAEGGDGAAYLVSGRHRYPQLWPHRLHAAHHADWHRQVHRRQVGHRIN